MWMLAKRSSIFFWESNTLPSSTRRSTLLSSAFASDENFSLLYDSMGAIVEGVVERIVLDTSVLVSALRSEGGASRQVLRLCLKRQCQSLIGYKLFREIEDVTGRKEVFKKSVLNEREREELVDALMNVSEWVPVFFLWRPNLPDEGDNHLVELAVAGMATAIVTSNVKDVRLGELRFPQIVVETPGEFMKRWRRDYGNDDD